MYCTSRRTGRRAAVSKRLERASSWSPAARRAPASSPRRRAVGHAASMIAAPGSSILPSRSRSSRLPPLARHASSSVEHRAARGRSAPCRPAAPRPAPARARSRARPPSPRRSWRRRPSPACAACAWPSCGQQVDALDRAVVPVVVGRREAARRLVVPVDEHAVVGDRLRVLAGRQEALPLVARRAVGRAGRGRRRWARIGSRPVVTSAMCVSSA